VLESISPTSVTNGGPAFTLTDGTALSFRYDLLFGSTELTSTTVNDTQITAIIDAKYISTPGTVEVFVSGIPGGSNLNGPCGGGPSNKLPFSIL
jgi:hypothetical protein